MVCLTVPLSLGECPAIVPWDLLPTLPITYVYPGQTAGKVSTSFYSKPILCDTVHTHRERCYPTSSIVTDARRPEGQLMPQVLNMCQCVQCAYSKISTCASITKNKMACGGVTEGRFQDFKSLHYSLPVCLCLVAVVSIGKLLATAPVSPWPACYHSACHNWDGL